MAHIQTESEWELEMCGKIIDYLAGKIYVDMRFMEPVLNVLVPRANMGLSTFATDGVYLYMNTRHTMDVFRKNENFLVRVYLHSVLHCVYSHIWLCDGRDENLWNLACDIAVERIIDRLDKPCVKRILTWRRQDIYKRLDDDKCVSSAQIYEFLLDINKEELNKLWLEFYTDDHTIWQYKNDRKNMIQQPHKVQQQWEQRARQMTMEKQKSDGESGKDENSLNELMRVQKRRRSYRDFLKKFAEYLPEITDEDMKLISQPLDFMGQNIYNGYMMRQGEDGEPEYVDREAGAAKTAAGWPVTPECFYYGVKFLYERYHLPLYITENGMSCHDDVSLDGRVHDPNRQNFLDLYISALQRANDDGADVRGYFLWTFLDNFEWDKGYTERFGIVYVDFKTQKRIVKDSAFWYQKIIESNGRELTVNKKTRPILFLNPVFKEMIWGGNQLAEKFGYEIPSDKTGECWAISAHPNGDCTVREGEYAGRKLSELFKEEPELFGNLPLDRFPLLIKIIDAKADLSIQVHPDDAYAKVHENGSLGKTECWYILDCPEDATLVVGHNAGSREELKEMIDQKRWSELIREVPVKKGDFIQINPGTVHAIKGGLMILETQQNSDITYRVYDYDRLSNGKPRELHVQQSIDVITVPAPSAEDSVSHAADLPANTMNELIACDYYKVYKLTVTEPVSFEQEHPFLIMSVIEGEGLVNGQMIRKGDHFILPSGFGKVDLQGDMTLIASSVK